MPVAIVTMAALGKPFMLLVLVAGARLLNYMQIEIGPFPLVA